MMNWCSSVSISFNRLDTSSVQVQRHIKGVAPYRPTVTLLRIGELILSTSDTVDKSPQDHNILLSVLLLM